MRQVILSSRSRTCAVGGSPASGRRVVPGRRAARVLAYGACVLAVAGGGGVAHAASPVSRALSPASGTAPLATSAASSQVLASSGPGRVDMQAAVNQAVRWHPLVRSAQGQLLQASEGITSARGGYYPRLSAGVSTTSGNDSVAGYDSRHVHRAQLTLSQMLYDFGKVGGQVDKAKAAQASAAAQVLQSLDQVVRGTAQAWVAVRRSEALVKTAQEQMTAVKALAQLARQRQTEGASTYSDTAQADARVDAAQVELLAAQSQVRQWRTTLLHWVGGGVLPDVRGGALKGLKRACTAGTLSAGDAASIQVAEAQVAVARAGVDIAKAQRMPTVSVSVTSGHGLNAASRMPGESSVDTSVMLNLSAPLYQGGQLRADERAAAYAVEAARASLDQARLESDQGLQTALLQWQQLSRQRKSQASRVESMRTTRVLYREQYLQLGTRSLLDLLNAEQEYHGALNDQINSEHDEMNTEVDCLYYSGQLRRAFELAPAVGAALGPLAGPGE
ncbi:hypothetical protein CDEF62S_01044 [Castellaniella defragrans]